MQDFESRFARLVLDYRWLFIIAMLTLVGVAASGIRLLQFQPDYQLFFDPDNPDLAAFEAMEATYTKSDNVIFVLAPRDGDIFTRRNLTALKELTDRCWRIAYATRVDSIANYQHTEADGDDLLVRDLVFDADQLDDEDIVRIRDIALNEPLLVRRLIAADGRVAGINVRTLIPRIDQTKEVPILTASLREAAAEFSARYPDIELHIGGQMMLDATFPEAGERDMRTLIPLSFLLMAVVLLVLTRSVTGTFSTLLVVALSVLAAMGLRGYSGLPLTAMSGSTPIIILTLAIANCVHLLTTFTHALNQGHAKRAALEESLRVNLQPVALASCTTALGFMTLNAIGMPPVRWMGNTAAAGVLIAFVLSVTILPAALSFLPVRTGRSVVDAFTYMERLGRWVVAKRGTLLPVASICVFVLVSQIPRNEINENIIDNNFDRSFAFRRATDFIAENLTGTFYIDYELSSGESGGVANPEFLAEVEQFAQWLRGRAEVIHVNVLTDTMKRLNKNLHADDPAWYRLPDGRELSAQYLLLYEMSLPYGLDLNDQINIDKSAIRVSVTTQTLSTRDLVAFEATVQDWLAEATREMRSSPGVGVSFMFSGVVQRSVPAIMLGTGLALIGISLLLAVAFRSLKFGLISLIPNLVPAAMGFGIWGILNGEVGFGISTVIGLTLGIVIDDTVHFMSKYLRARREMALDSPAAVVYAFTTVGSALVVTSIVLAVGFLVLSTSPFGANAHMATLTSIVIGLALAADFFFLPPLLMKLEDATQAAG